VVWINGYGWPAYRGGPMFYADAVGPKTVLARLQAYQSQFGDDFRPAALLEAVAATGGRLGDF
jgi:3-hydroxyacyl-CoA dehydrogenase